MLRVAGSRVSVSVFRSALVQPALRRHFSSEWDHTGPDRVVEVNSSKEFDKALSDGKGLAVADFTATWCPPCRVMNPVFKVLSNRYPDVTFLKVDIDNEDNFDTVKENEVTSVPTFTFHKDGQRVASFSGADIRALQRNLDQLR